MIEKVGKTIKDHKMIAYGDKIVVGVSGGADSVALLHVLFQLRKGMGLTLFVVHVNHGIRGTEAKEDENFVVQLCKDMKISCEVVEANVPLLAKTEGMTEEEAGRKIRYEAFEKALKQQDAQKIAVAHNALDQAETVLMRLCRGAGLTGLRGIVHVRGKIIRPLLDCSRQEIEQWLAENNIAYCTDSTNLHTEYTRNKIRLELLPYLERELNSKASQNIVKTAAIIKEEDAFIEQEAFKAYQEALRESGEDELRLDISALNKLHPVLYRRVVRRGFRELGWDIQDLSFDHVEDIMALAEGKSGKKISLPKGFQAQKEYDVIKLQSANEIKCETGFSYDLKEDVETFVKEGGIYVFINKK